MKGYRYEYKYAISRAGGALLKAQLAAVLPRDRHVGPSGRYFIRSLYFDDADLSAYYEKLAGTYQRRKYRLRYYNFDPRYLTFECKRKFGQLTRKDGLRVDQPTAELLIAGADLPASALEAPLLGEYQQERTRANLRPRVIVDYFRTPFVYSVSNVRITIDEQVSTGLYVTDGFFRPITVFPVMEPEEALLEVKFDEFLPDHIKRVLSTVPAICVANSKYCNCLAPCEPVSYSI